MGSPNLYLSFIQTYYNCPIAILMTHLRTLKSITLSCQQYERLPDSLWQVISHKGADRKSFRFYGLQESVLHNPLYYASYFRTVEQWKFILCSQAKHTQIEAGFGPQLSNGLATCAPLGLNLSPHSSPHILRCVLFLF